MMKRICNMAMLLMMAVTMQAQSLVGGSWFMREKDDATDMKMYVSFTDKGEVFIRVEAFDDIPEVGPSLTTAKMPGTYKRNGNKVTIRLNTKDSSLRIEPAIHVDLPPGVSNEGVQKIGEKYQMLNQIAQHRKEDLMKDMTLSGKLTIYELTDQKLVMDDQKEDPYSFTRVTFYY